MAIEENNSKAVEHLEKKYNEEFVGIKWYDDNVYGCRPVSNEDWIVKVYFLKEDGQKFIRDDYYGLLKKDEYLELTNNITRQWFPDEEIKIFSRFTSSFFVDEYRADTPLVDVMANNSFHMISCIDVFIAEDEGLNKDVFEAKCNNLVESLESANYTTLLVVYAIHNDYLAIISEDNYTNYFLRNKRSRESGYLSEFRKVIKSHH